MTSADTHESFVAVQRTRSRAAWWAIAAAVILTSACESASAGAPRPSPAPSNTAAVATGPRFIVAPSDLAAVEPFIQQQLELSFRAGSRTLIYVGAPWCEPCQRFHAAVLAGKLDRALARTRLLEFDAERHGAALHSAGYAYEFVPVIALPNPDGRSSGHLLSGSIKGPSAVENDILPRLRALLDGRQVD